MMYSMPKVSPDAGFYVLHFNIAAIGTIDPVLSIASPCFQTMFEAEQFMMQLPCAPMQVIASDGQHWIQFIADLQQVMPDCPCLTQWQIVGLSKDELSLWAEVVPISYLRPLGYYDFRLVSEDQSGVVCIDCKRMVNVCNVCKQVFDFSFIIQ